MNLKILSDILVYTFVALLISSITFAIENQKDNSLILDLSTDTTNWKLSSTSFPKWFEYFDNTTQLKINLTGTCSEIISNTTNNLDDVNGIWVSCYDPTLSLDCESLGSHSCYPEINFPRETLNAPFLRSVKFRIALLGQATLRINVENQFCIDYSHRKDPMSRCQYIEILPELKWVDAEILTDESINFRTFSIQLFARFKGDAVLIDKIEAIENSPVTVSNAPTTAIKSSTQSSELFPSILDTESDASLPVDYQWKLADKFPKWMEYYADYATFLYNKTDTSSCAYLISSQFTIKNLPDVSGIWSSCRNYPTCSINPSVCHPSINYTSADEHYVHSIKSKFHLQGGTAAVRLHAGGKCWDYKFENSTSSPCEFVQVPQIADQWNTFDWTGEAFLSNQKVIEFQLELVYQSSPDVVLLDTIEVQYKKCENIDECFDQPTNPPELTSTEAASRTTEEETTTNCDDSTITTEDSKLTDGTTTTKESVSTDDTTKVTIKTSELTESTEGIETSTDSDGTICTTRVSRTTTPRSGSSAGVVINMFIFIIVFVGILVK